MNDFHPANARASLPQTIVKAALWYSQTVGIFRVTTMEGKQHNSKNKLSLGIISAVIVEIVVCVNCCTMYCWKGYLTHGETSLWPVYCIAGVEDMLTACQVCTKLNWLHSYMKSRGVGVHTCTVFAECRNVHVVCAHVHVLCETRFFL